MQGNFERAREHCGKMKGYPKQMWETLVGTYERIHTTIHRDRDPGCAAEMLKEAKGELTFSLQRRLRADIDALTRELRADISMLTQTGHPRRAERVTEHLPKKVRKDVRRTLRQANAPDARTEKQEPTPSGPNPAPSEHAPLLLESSHATAVLDDIDQILRSQHWNPKKPSGLSPTERAILCVIIRTEEDGQPPPSIEAIMNITGYAQGRVKKAVRHFSQYRLKPTDWQLKMEGEICTIERKKAAMSPDS